MCVAANCVSWAYHPLNTGERLMSASDTKPCPKCAKPLRPDAANCWFCGVVFGVVRCVECGSPNRTGSPACQICGEPLPSPLLVAASDTPPAAPRASEQDCPGCGGPVPLAAIRCKHCGAELDSPARQQAARWSGATVRRSRSGSLIAAAVVSFLFNPCGCGFITGGMNFKSVAHFVIGFAVLAGGLFLCTAAVVIAFLDLKGMRTGRVNPAGRTSTLIAGWLNGFMVLLYWCAIGYCIFALL